MLWGLAIVVSSCNVLVINKQEISMYKPKPYRRSLLKGCEKLEGEPIEHKIQRVMKNNEPITDGAPLIYTEKSAGIVAAYNIRTDRFEIAAEAMDLVHKNKAARSQGKGLVGDEGGKVVDMKGNGVGRPESTEGTKTGSSSTD